jgi:penicillin-binding protein 2
VDYRVRLQSRILLGVFGVIFILLGLRAFQLQVFGYSRYAKLAENNRVKLVSIHAPRGRIFSRDGRILADARPGYSISILPYQIGRADSLIAKLSPVMGIGEDVLRDLIEKAEERPLLTQTIARDVSMEVVSWIEEHKLDLPGVAVEIEPIRRYPLSDTACHAIGYVGEISPKQLEALSGAGYKHGDIMGQTGLESQDEGYLRGQDGVQFVEVDAKGREVGVFPDRKPIPSEPGGDLYLTIDSRLQVLAAQALAGYERACAFGMDPKTGEVLVYYCKPGYDPNLFAVGVSKEVWDALTASPSSPLWDRVTRSGYPPGSIYKVVTASAALESKVAGRWTKFAPCTGSFRYGNRSFACWGVHGRLTIVPAIIHSCDIFFYQLGIAAGIDRLAEMGLNLGFGRKTGLDIPDEGSGLVPTSKWYNSHFGKGKWSKGVTLNLAIGQGEILCTPAQICEVISSISTGGMRCKPHILSRVVSHRGVELYKASVEKERIALSDSTIEILKEGMYGVVNDPSGTGGLARSQLFKIAGKTGTAENPPKEDHALFVGYGPFDSPEICIVVVIENAGHGGSVAGPVAGRLIEAYLSMVLGNGAT